MRVRRSLLASVVAAAVPGVCAPVALAQTVTFDSPGTYVFVVPAGVTSLTVEVRGGGGGGGGGELPGGGGGGAGASGSLFFAVAPGDVCNLQVGAGGGGGRLRGPGVLAEDGVAGQPSSISCVGGAVTATSQGGNGGGAAAEGVPGAGGAGFPSGASGTTGCGPNGSGGAGGGAGAGAGGNGGNGYDCDLASDGANGTAGRVVITIDAPCTRRISGYYGGAVTIRSGDVACFDNATVAGVVTVQPGGSFRATASTFNGSITSTGADQLRLCGSSVGGALRVQSSPGRVQIGDGDEGCAGNTLRSTLVVTGNTGGFEIDRNQIAGTTTITNNSSGPGEKSEVTDNRIGGSLTCAGNTPPPTGGNNTTGAAKTGQCAAL